MKNPFKVIDGGASSSGKSYTSDAGGAPPWGGDGGDGPRWHETVEKRLSELRNDFRLLLAGLGTLGLAMFGLYVWMGTKTDDVLSKLSPISDKAIILEEKTKMTNEKIISIDNKLDVLSKKADELILSTKKK